MQGSLDTNLNLANGLLVLLLSGLKQWLSFVNKAAKTSILGVLGESRQRPHSSCMGDSFIPLSSTLCSALVSWLHSCLMTTQRVTTKGEGSPDQPPRRGHRLDRRWSRSPVRWCTGCCSWWSPPTAAESPRSPPMSDCRSRRLFQRSRAWQQRSYLSNVCVGEGAERTEDKRKDECNRSQQRSHNHRMWRVRWQNK